MASYKVKPERSRPGSGVPELSRFFSKKVPKSLVFGDLGTFCGEDEIRTRDTVTRMQV